MSRKVERDLPLKPQFSRFLPALPPGREPYLSISGAFHQLLLSSIMQGLVYVQIRNY